MKYTFQFAPSLLLLTAVLLLVPGCTPSSDGSSGGQDGVTQKNGTVRIDKSDVDSMRNAAKSTSSAAADSAPKQMIWLGALLSHESNRTVVRAVIKSVDGVDLMEGDVIQAVNGTSVESPQEVSDRFEKIDEGEPVRLDLLRSETDQTIVFARPDASEVPNLRMTTMQ